MTGGAASKITKSKARGKAPAKNVVPDVYREMLADAVISSPTQTSDDGRPIKRRRVGGRIVTQHHDDPASHQSEQSNVTGNDSDLGEFFEDVEPYRQQSLQNESDDSADSDMDWEEIKFGEGVAQGPTPERETEEVGELNLVLGPEGQESELTRQQRLRRKPAKAEEKRLRLQIHKMHLCSLIAHVYIRNHWCNDGEVQTALKKLFTKNIISYLNPDESKSQFQRSRSFTDGLKQASDAFRLTFKITARGLSKPRWADSPETLAQMQPPDDVDLPMQKSDFCDVAKGLKASRDVGAQLFCALLRSTGVDARLVCSLLPLPFQPAEKVTLQRAAHGTPKILKSIQRQSMRETESESDDRSDEPGPGCQSMGSSGGRTRFEADGSRTSRQTKRTTSPEIQLAVATHGSKKRKHFRESKYPVYWVEAFNKAVQKWVPIDPLVTRTIARPSKFEPPAGEASNSMSYVIAFEDNGSFRDVTGRYTKAYNAKTRRERVEVTPGGERWWRRVLKLYRRSYALDRDHIEDAELAAKAAAEPMPRNVQDYKDHPYYALERHLKRHEVVHPKREVGKVGSGRAANTISLEPVYRRNDVLTVKSAEKWYKLGRKINPGEQPLKRVPARRTREVSVDPEDSDAENAGTALYAAHQTTLYSAPPIENGRISKNVYGNLDVYVPSMVPLGGIHMTHPETARAARILGIDYADAVTGFAFKGKHGTAIMNGAVVPIECREAVEAVVRAFDDERVRIEEEMRSAEALRMWKRFLTGLRIRERIEGYDIEGERDIKMREEMEAVDEIDDAENNDGGGFLPDRDAKDFPQPTAADTLHSKASTTAADDYGGGFLTEEPAESSMIQRDLTTKTHLTRHHSLSNIEDNDRGGFLVNDSDADADAEEPLRATESNNLNDSKPRDIYDSLPKSPTKVLRTQEPHRQIHGSGILPDEPNTHNNHPQPDIPPSNHNAPITPHNPTPSPQQPLPHKPSPSPSPAPTLPHHIPILQQPPNPPTTNQAATQSPTDPNHLLPTLQPASSPPQPNPITPETPASEHEHDSEHDSDSDNGSLVSEDPEDEDADPEWLA